MKTAISIPDEVFNEAERLMRRKRMSRSELYVNAIRCYIRKERGAGLTEQLNRVYHGTANPIDEVVERTGLADLGKEDWS